MIDNSSFPIIGGGCESINLFCGCVEGLGRLGSAHRWWGFKEYIQTFTCGGKFMGIEPGGEYEQWVWKAR